MKTQLSRRFFSPMAAVAVCGLLASSADAKPNLPTTAEALKLAPVQQDIEFDRPAKADVEKCRVDSESAGKVRGFIVYDQNGQVLRRFVDTNGDNSIDQWCYFRDGVEVYRDVDGDGNGKADQYRWLGVAGIRWGLDKDEDTKIDSWKQISAEEVTEEVVAALRTKDLVRFKRVLLSQDELKSLELPSDRATDLGLMLTAAAADFADLAKKQKVVVADTKWISFGGGKPGVVPATAASKPDVIVYDNVAAVVETAEKHAQVAIGTLVRVGEGWRVIDAPRGLLDESNATPLAGFFFQAPLAKGEEGAIGGGGNIDPQLQKLVADLEKVDKDLAAATSKDKLAKLNAARADLIEKIIELAKGEDRETWLRQYAETVSAAVQSGGFPEGVDRLKKLQSQLARQPGQENLVVFVGYRALQTDYNQSLQEAKESQIPMIHSAWVDGLEKLVTQYTSSEQAAEPMLALAQEYEISGKEEQAIEWYGKILKDFKDSEFAKKALGGKRRLESIGNRWMISGPTIDGKGNLNAAALSGKVVVVQYWATWCDQCKQDFATLKTLQAKYGKNLQVVSVNLDSNRDDALKQLKSTPLSWPTLFEPGGFDSRYANEMGIFSLPLMILVDKQGKVVSRNITAEELDAELRKLVK